MEHEYSALLANNTWDLIPRPSGSNIVTGKWVFKHKFKADGSLERYKARWVLRGFTQRPGIDFSETFSPVVKPATVRTVLSLALSRGWPIHQLDVNNAFLHGTLSETVHCAQPAGFEDPSHPDYVCRLNRSLYGLKQAPRAWYSRFASHLLQLGFVEAKSDTSLFVYRRGALQYLTFTRPDISYAVQQSDADWAGCPDTCKSTSGYAVFLGDNLVSWSSKRQNTVSRSSAEAEYRSVANAVAEATWLRQLLSELHTPLRKTTLVYCDNISTVYMSSNPVQNQRTKHVEIDLHFVRERVALGDVRVLHVPTTSQFADVFTKGLPSAAFTEFRSSLNVCSTYVSTAGGC
ncbi:hypothetical protein U9M48_009871 [Paspalum notatum var. saurae]|uniref:Reverse transcriptase Ty1/copia-type domain-containing protein n=1 Tax=Paspalum notatum var. saurae TaxID=547442 RepID=A0AAQ3WFK4_PASNO